MRLIDNAAAAGMGVDGGAVVLGVAGFGCVDALDGFTDCFWSEEAPIVVVGVFGPVEAAWAIGARVNKITRIRRTRVYRSMGRFLSYEVEMEFLMVLYPRAVGLLMAQDAE